MNLAASRLTWFQLTKAPFVGPKIVFTMLPVDVRLLIDPPHPITRYSSSIMIHVCWMFYFYLLQGYKLLSSASRQTKKMNGR